jgi:DNA-binding MarR family transcriptional regulator
MDSREPPDDPLTRVIDSLRRILQAIRLSSSTVHDALGITGAQLFVLQQLAERPGASLRELAERTLTDQSSVSVVVGRLVEAGYVARRVSAADARRSELTLSEPGKALLRRAPGLAQTRLVASLRGVPPARLRVTAQVLESAARALGGSRAPAPMFFEPPAGPRRGARGKPASSAARSRAARTRGPRSGRGRTR